MRVCSGPRYIISTSKSFSVFLYFFYFMIYQNYRSPYGDTVMEKYEVGRKNVTMVLQNFCTSLAICVHMVILFEQSKTGDGNK